MLSGINWSFWFITTLCKCSCSIIMLISHIAFLMLIYIYLFAANLFFSSLYMLFTVIYNKGIRVQIEFNYPRHYQLRTVLRLNFTIVFQREWWWRLLLWVFHKMAYNNEQDISTFVTVDKMVAGVSVRKNRSRRPAWWWCVPCVHSESYIASIYSEPEPWTTQKIWLIEREKRLDVLKSKR